jgi:hypothetical protein
MSQPFYFYASEPQEWPGRFPAGGHQHSLFYLRLLVGRLWPCVDWETRGRLLVCPALKCSGVRFLIEAVADARMRLNRLSEAGEPLAEPGSVEEQAGPFLITEFGRLLVPAQPDKHRVISAGQCQGSLIFLDPENDGRLLDLSDDEALSTGDLWDKPAAGSQYSLSRHSRIHLNQAGKEIEPPQQDRALIDKLRSVCPHGPLKFIVNPWGIVLLRRPLDGNWEGEGPHETVYIDRLDLDLWFAPEDTR